MGYKDLTDEDKLEEAIRFIAADQPLPETLITWLHENNLYDLVTNPQRAK